MKIEGYIQPKSSFLGIEKDTAIITDKIIRNPRLQRLLYYTTPDALSRENLTQEQIQQLFVKNITLVPKLPVDPDVLTYIIISFDNFYQSKNPEFKDAVLEFDILCHFNQWKLKEDFALRPYKIAGEIDAMFNGQKLTGIGETQFLSASQIVLNDEFAGLCLRYEVIHGGEDRVKMPNQKDQEQFLKDFADYVND